MFQHRLPRLLLSTILTLTCAILPAFPPVLRYNGGEATREELDDVALIQGSKGGDFVARYIASSDPETRADVQDSLEYASRAYPWLRTVAAEARVAKFQLPADFNPTLRSEVVSNTAQSWKAVMLKRYAVEDEARLDDLLEKYRGELEKPERRDTRYIFRYVAPGTSAVAKAAAKAEMEALRRRILAGELTFTEAATLHSDAPSAAKGGYLGSILPSTRMAKPLLDLIFACKQDQISPVEEFPNGYYIVLVEAIYPPISAPIGAWRTNDDIRIGLLSRAGEARFAEDIRIRRPLRADSNSWIEVAYAWAQQEKHTDPQLERYNGLLNDLLLAQAYFFDKKGLIAPPTDEEMRAYYEENKRDMVGKGMFKVTRFTVPVTSPDKGPIINRAKALEVAEAAAARARDGVTTETIELEFANRGLQIHNHHGWLQSTDNGPIDRELLKASAGYLSSIQLVDEGAIFVLLHDRRAAPIESYFERRDYLARTVWSIKRATAMRQDQTRVSEELGLRMLWKEMAPPLKK